MAGYAWTAIFHGHFEYFVNIVIFYFFGPIIHIIGIKTNKRVWEELKRTSVIFQEENSGEDGLVDSRVV